MKLQLKSINDAMNGIVGGFVWSETEEGEEFWKQVILKLRRISNSDLKALIEQGYPIDSEARRIAENNVQQIQLFE
jgi:hypothetical protein